ncbi:D-alanyl-lipoteichoic acid acyltransferase DltB (MBOAT superfamily) [Natranaerovirga hydrolytica]|uniref:D-alanyl-lipoteichoic acid acyltransferase DltB (MBOAT superfamily) n=1 Tax=Natranaerovirga hydrolytica TaxID=680378 RepID=A0A4R1MX17_9FIRM|nr:MBOAT family O-acyltransferase [Natranaerovirga hydrolytica]TCK97787.1 D-alanyl-lipoteichoic acid acyltransferase DltB (MBOAT superfamily) [Natranaerovirga hydrolytica]
MLFNSFEFILFFLIVISIYFILPYRLRWVLLLASSYYFYMAWKPEYVLLIIFSTIVDYLVSRRMGQVKEKKKRKKYLFISLLTNLGLLIFFKYAFFISESLNGVFSTFNITYPLPTNFSIILPMGISFYTFQTLSYTIDVYRGKIKPEKHFGVFALYVSFFPQLVAGPIERSDRLIPQFYKKHKFDLKRIGDGLKLMLVGFFKKLVIADRVAMVVNHIYNQPSEFEGLYLVIATLLFGFQILCDFSGYSDIAIGTAKVLGIDLMTNFKSPYFATSIKDFWKRWHISLSTWFKDYVYIPLGGNRVKLPRMYFNLFVTFLISGLWHGANWNFVIWGGLHGCYQIIGNITKPIKDKIINLLKLNRLPFILPFIQRVVTFALVTFAWIFFRANTFEDARYIISHLLVDIELWLNSGYVYDVGIDLGVTLTEVVMIILSIMVLLMIEWFGRKESIHLRLLRTHFIIRWAFYYLLIIMVFTMGVFYDGSEFIYFQF